MLDNTKSDTIQYENISYPADFVSVDNTNNIDDIAPWSASSQAITPEFSEYIDDINSNTNADGVVPANNNVDNNPPETFIFNVAKGDTPAIAIQKLMSLCSVVNSDAADVAVSYNVITEGPVHDDDYARMNYYVEPKDFGGSVTKDVDIEYDYIFTGDNIDVINFVMDADLYVTSYSASIENAPIPPDKDQAITDVWMQQRIDESVDTDYSKLTTNPINASTSNTTIPDVVDKVTQSKTLRPLSNVKDNSFGMGSLHPSAMLRGRKALSNYVALNCNLQPTLEIKGNPLLIMQTLNASIDTGGKPTSTNTSLFTTVKVNVKMPKPATSVSDKANDTTENLQNTAFWYTGKYYISHITHNFSKGKFTQILQLIRLPDTTLAQQQDVVPAVKVIAGLEEVSKNSETATIMGATYKPVVNKSVMVADMLDKPIIEVPILLLDNYNGNIPTLNEMHKMPPLEIGPSVTQSVTASQPEVNVTQTSPRITRQSVLSLGPDVSV
jgi:hypothetical protein